MRVVGLRELKNRLSEYVRLVRAGEVVLVTDRGEVVAELRRPGQSLRDSEIEPGLLELANRGLVRLVAPTPPISTLPCRRRCGRSQRQPCSMPNAATTNLYAESSAVLAWLLGEPREHDARQPFPREPIRALDAIHLASTLTARSAVRHMVLLSLDDRIRAAARIMGLDVVPA